MIKIEKFVVNPLGENSYLLSDETGDCIFIDPGFYYGEEHGEIREHVKKNKLNPVKIVNTHCHFDHVMGVEFIREEYSIPFCAHEEDAFLLERAKDQSALFGIEMKPVGTIDQFLQEGEKVTFGNSELEVFHIPGHAPGHVVFYSNDNGFLIAGDVIFYGSIGRTDLPGGDFETLISGIHAKIFTLPDDTQIYCGHGPETTVATEKKSNPFLT